MSEKLNIKDFPYHTHAAIIEVANTAIAKAYEAGQRNIQDIMITAAKENEVCEHDMPKLGFCSACKTLPEEVKP